MFDPVMFVSLGPGDPELITLKGLKILQQADIIFCPSTSAATGKIVSRAKNILLELGIDEQKIFMFDVPMSKDRTQAITSYKTVSEKIAENYHTGYKVVVTAEGDAGFYSSVHYISDNLILMGIPVKRIAGVPAFIACGSLSNIHMVKQEEELSVIPGIITLESLRKKIAEGKSVVIMKPSQSEYVIKQAISSITDVTFHYFENAGVKEKEFYSQNKTEILNRTFPYFSLLIIRK